MSVSVFEIAMKSLNLSWVKFDSAYCTEDCMTSFIPMLDLVMKLLEQSEPVRVARR